MELKKEDYEKYVTLEVNLDDLVLLDDLLKLETIWQIKKQVAKEGDVEDRTESIVHTVSVFQEFDTQIQDLKKAVIDFNYKYEKVKEKPQNVMVLSVNRAKFYHFLCKNTVQLMIPDSVKVKFDQIGHDLVRKLEEAINSEPIFTDSHKELVEESNKPSETPDSFKINMLGQKGWA